VRDARAYTAEQLRTADGRIRRQCHPKQGDFVFDDGMRISLLVGRGGGKTLAALLRILRCMMGGCDRNALFIAATRQSAERLVWRDLKRLVLALRLSGVEFSESELTCTLPNGSQLLLYGCDDRSDVQKLRGLTWHAVVVDETASIKIELLVELLVEVIGPRAVGAIVLMGTPGKRLEGIFYDVTRTGSPEHRAWVDRDLPEHADWTKWSSHAWNITDGCDAGIAAMIELRKVQLDEKRRNGWSDTNPYWLREYMGQWASDDSQNVYAYRAHDAADGREWNQWSPKLSAAGYAILPTTFKDWGYGIGIDVGFKDAFALEVFAFSYSDPTRTLYHVYEVYRTRMYAQAIAKLLIGEDLNHDRYGGIIGVLGWPDAMVGDFAGAGGALLAELSTVYGITIAAADKPYKYKDNAIELVNSDLHDGRIKVLKGSALATELTTLQWVVDQYGKRAENKAQANHATDAAMYIRNALAVLLPPAGGPPQETSAVAAAQRALVEDDEVPKPEVPYGDADTMYAPGDW